VLMLITAGAEMLGFSHQVLLPSLARDVLRAGPEGLGALNAARSIGGIVGLAAASTQRGGGAFFVGVVVAFGASLIVLALAPHARRRVRGDREAAAPPARHAGAHGVGAALPVSARRRAARRGPGAADGRPRRAAERAGGGRVAGRRRLHARAAARRRAADARDARGLRRRRARLRRPLRSLSRAAPLRARAGDALSAGAGLRPREPLVPRPRMPRRRH